MLGLQLIQTMEPLSLFCLIILSAYTLLCAVLKGFKETAQYFDVSLGQVTTYKDYMRSQLSYE